MSCAATTAAARGSTRQPASRLRAALGRVPIEGVVFVVALASRLSVMVRAGGLHGSYGYDGPVYFAAADAFVHGRMPYRDFVLLHPPGLMLVLTPVAALTHFVSDESAFTIANLMFAALGAGNAVLVVRIGRALGFPPAATLAGGLFYATWFGAIGAEYLTKLEPLGNAFFLLALLLTVRSRQRSSTRASWGAGLMLGATLSVKIWWIVPIVAIVSWYAVAVRRPRPVLVMAGGILMAATVINLPFFLAAPRQMWSSVIGQQLDRQPTATGRATRIADLTAVPRLHGHVSTAVLVIGTGLFLSIMVVAGIGAWQVRRSRPVVVLLLLQMAVLLAAPSFFDHYCDYPAAAAALVVAAAAARYGEFARAGSRRLLSWAPAAAAATVSALVVISEAAVLHPSPGSKGLARSVSGMHCVLSDTPMALIELDVLSRDLADGCRNWVDVTGRTYGADRSAGGQTDRSKNTRWQHDLTKYLRSGEALIVARRAATGISRRTQQQLSRDGVLAHAGGQVVYRVGH